MMIILRIESDKNNPGDQMFSGEEILQGLMGKWGKNGNELVPKECVS